MIVRFTVRRALEATRHPAGIAALALVLLSAKCGETVAPPEDTSATLVVSANLAGTRATLLTVVVTAPDIAPPVVVNIPVTGSSASGTLTLTAGSDRIVTVHAYDAAGVETHRGADTITVQPGSNPSLDLTLVPLTGGVPIVVTIAGLRVAVTPTPDTLVAGGLTHQLAAAVTTTGGAPVAGALVQWATLEPGVATVSSSGVVTGVAPGTTQIIASYAGVAGAATVVVLDPASVPPALQPIATGLSSPVFATSAPGDSLRLFVIEQTGQIRVIRRDTLLATPFLNLSSLVSCCGERGLLGLAFHPQYASNGFFFVNYTDTNGDTRVARYHVTGNPEVADPASATPVLSQAQPFPNHNGGWLGFGPDGLLYVALGDGGASGDPQGNGQNMNTLLGKILRINVDQAGYTVPPGNPFVGVPNTRPEIWASGLRNPWRNSFDRQTGEFYIADVGQNEREEVDIQPATNGGGRNYGWVIMEGDICYLTGDLSCNMTGLTPPVLYYTHHEGCSISGGYVYRGRAIPMLNGLYFYSDYCSGWIRSSKYSGGAATQQTEWTQLNGGSVSSFGEDYQGELYIVRYSGTVQRIVPAKR